MRVYRKIPIRWLVLALFLLALLALEAWHDIELQAQLDEVRSHVNAYAEECTDRTDAPKKDAASPWVQ